MLTIGEDGRVKQGTVVIAPNGRGYFVWMHWLEENMADADEATRATLLTKPIECTLINPPDRNEHSVQYAIDELEEIGSVNPERVFGRGGEVRI